MTTATCIVAPAINRRPGFRAFEPSAGRPRWISPDGTHLVMKSRDRAVSDRPDGLVYEVTYRFASQYDRRPIKFRTARYAFSYARGEFGARTFDALDAEHAWIQAQNRARS